MHPLRNTRIRTSVYVVAVVAALLGPQAPAPAEPASPGPAAAEAVCGTPQKGHAACFAMRRTDVAGTRGLRADGPPDGYGPGDLRSAYGLPAGGGAGVTVAVVAAYDNPNAESDLAVYRAQFGLPECLSATGCFRKVDQRGGTAYPNRDARWGAEISLDLDMVSAVAPLARIVLVEADSDGFGDLAAAVDQAVAQGAQVVSNSYGTFYFDLPGSGEDPLQIDGLDVHYNHPGVAIVASAGDSAYGVTFPAASPYVTAVGGTALARDGSDRGFSETVWYRNINGVFNGTGSGCSVVQPKPAFQKDTGCAHRTVADVAAVADPATGVAVYDTYGTAGHGWGIFGGTSVSAPIIAGVYAIAGAPVAGTYPNAYPYTHRGDLNDVTTGSNALTTCDPKYLCTAGPGYDGPSGLGTPAGPAAFAMGPHGTLTGTVTDRATGTPVAGAAIRAGDYSTTTDAAGRYALVLPAGTYDVSVDAYGFVGAHASGRTVADGASVTTDIALDGLPRSTISGTVTDGSGHGWPLYAKITVDGVPGAPVFSDPYTGRYSLTLPENVTYTAHVTAVYPGYAPVDLHVQLGADDQHRDVPVPVDVAGCDAPGYTVHYAGSLEAFDGPTTPPGWTVTNANAAGGWQFDDPRPLGNRTGGSGHFAVVDSQALGTANREDTILTSPVTDVSDVDAPVLSFDTAFRPWFGTSTVDVDISVDGGATWTTVWHQDERELVGPAHVDLPLPAAAAVIARFHYNGGFVSWWQVDNVRFGRRTCDKVGGGLVVGRVTDANTGAGLVGATVSATSGASTASTVDGFFWMFAPAGAQAFTTTRRTYSTVTKTLDVAADGTTRGDVALPAGRVTASGSISRTVAWGGSTTAKVTITNTGTAPATVSIAEQPGRIEALTGGGAEPNVVRSPVTPLSLSAAGKASRAAGAVAGDVTPSAAPWTSIADYPTAVEGNLVDVFGGKVYSVYGWTGNAVVADLYVYDPNTGAWTQLARAADIREAPSGAFIAGRLYATGGWGADNQPDRRTEVYDPDTNLWTTAAANPRPAAGAGSATLNGKLFVIGGCGKLTCGRTDVNVYDPVSDTWSAAADYPEPIAWQSCGTLSGKVYCSGGLNSNASVTHTYVYDPTTDTWAQRAPMPADLWGSAHTTAGGRLLVSGGAVDNSVAVTNQGYAYDPVTDTWGTLPNSNDTLFRGGSACGLYRIGGTPPGLLMPPVARSEVLPGFTDCASVADVPWLSESVDRVTLPPGGRATVTLTLTAPTTQPSTYAASLLLTDDTPYPAPLVDVTMTVTPPKTWGRIAGTVTGTDGRAIAGATVQIETWAASYTVRTDKNGRYSLWLDVRNNPLQLIVARDGYQPQVRTVKIAKGTTTTADFVLKPAPV